MSARTPLHTLPMWARCCVVLAWLTLTVVCGVALRMVAIPSPALAAALMGGVVVIPMAVTAVRRLTDRGNPGWADQERQHGQARPVSVQGSLALQAIDSYLTGLPQAWWRSVRVSVLAGRPGQPALSLYPNRNRLLVVAHPELVAEMGPSLVVTTLARMQSLARGWRYRLRVALTFVRLSGLLILGWAVSWPWLLAALVVFQAAITATSWLIELSADRYILAHRLNSEVLVLLSYTNTTESARWAGWRNWAVIIVSAISGRLPLPARFRWAAARLGRSQDTPGTPPWPEADE